MDKLSIIAQLELDISALQRLTEDFKKHPESISPAEWQLFVQRLHLMHEYCKQLKMEVEQVRQPEEKKEEIVIAAAWETVQPSLNVQGIVAKETLVESQPATPAPVQRIEIKEELPLKHEVSGVVTHQETTVRENKSVTQKPKKQTVSVGGLFGDTHSLADNFKEEPTIGDKIAKTKSEKSVADKIHRAPVKDLKDAIGINEKFLFINELFDGNLQDYSEALNKLNAFENLQSAEEFINVALVTHYSWDDASQHVKNFKDLVERRFIS